MTNRAPDTAFPHLDLSGKTVLITGSAGGLGFAMAQAFSRCGALVAVNDLREAAAAEAAAALPGEALAVAGDVSREDEAERMVNAVVKKWGKLDILINNAAVAEPFAVTTKQSLDDWQRVMDVNLKGTFLMARAAGKEMIPRREGVIVNVSSVTGLMGFPASNAYGVSKAAVVMLTKTLATEFARYQIRVNAVAPGFVMTPMNAPLPQEFVDLNIRRMPMGRCGEAEEIARAVVFLASDWASFITGVTLPVDGGWSAFGAVGEASRPKKATEGK